MTERKNSELAPPLERAVALLGAALVIALFGMLVYYSLRDDGVPPDVTVRAEAVEALNGQYLVPIEAENRGGATAANVRITGELTDTAGVTVERSTVVLDYVPVGSRQRGGLYFLRDPRELRLALRAEGYAEP